jgi:RNA polymerase sigma-70 factor (ECF subfamily)
MRKTRTILSADEAAWLMAKTANERDRAAFSALFDFYGPQIKAFMMRSGFPSSAAEELVQETMLLVWKKASSFDVSRASVSTWIFTIARNLRIDRLRRENRPHVQSEPFDPSDLPDEPLTGEAIVMSSQRAERIRAALAMLSAEQAEVVRLSFYGDKAQTEIASELGIPLGTVKSRVRLALARLRQILDDLK